MELNERITEVQKSTLERDDGDKKEDNRQGGSEIFKIQHVKQEIQLKSPEHYSSLLKNELAYQRKMWQHIQETIKKTTHMDIQSDSLKIAGHKFYWNTGISDFTESTNTHVTKGPRPRMSFDGRHLPSQYYNNYYQPTVNYSPQENIDVRFAKNKDEADSIGNSGMKKIQQNYLDIYRESKKANPNKMFINQMEVETENSHPLIHRKAVKLSGSSNWSSILPSFSNCGMQSHHFHDIGLNENLSSDECRERQTQALKKFSGRETIDVFQNSRNQTYLPSAQFKSKGSNRQDSKLLTIRTSNPFKNEWETMEDIQKVSIDINLSLKTPRDIVVPEVVPLRMKPFQQLPYHVEPTIALKSIYPQKWRNTYYEHGDSKKDSSNDSERILSTTHEHFKKGKRGLYRVFDINDYKKLKREMQLHNIAGSEPDLETVEEKKEKLAIKHEYGRLVREKNRKDIVKMKQSYPSSTLLE